MKDLFKTIHLYLAAVAMLFMCSCQQDEINVIEPIGVEFTLAGDRVSGSSQRSADDDFPTVEECDMGLAAYALIEIDGMELQVDIKQWGDDYKTNLIELDPGDYTVSSFQVYDEEDNPLFATPMFGSKFSKFVDQTLPVDIEIENYRKIEYDIEVLCVEDFTPPSFGFAFWNIDMKETKNLCIFANYCDPEVGHKVATLSAYVFPNSDQTDMETDLIWSDSADGDYNSETESNSLLCLKFPYNPDVETAEQSYYVVLMVNDTEYAATVSLETIDEINMEYDYLHLNKNCEGDFAFFEPTEDDGNGDGEDDGEDDDEEEDEEDVTTTFEDGEDDGWLVSGDAQGGSVQADVINSGGNPGAYLEATDDVQGGVWYWDAPDKYNGDYFGGTLSFDLKQSATDSQFDSNDVIIEGGGLTLALDLPNNPGTDWTSYSVSLDTDTDWRINSIGGAEATDEEVETVLENITSLFIRGEYRTGPDTGGLDNPTISED